MNFEFFLNLNQTTQNKNSNAQQVCNNNFANPYDVIFLNFMSTKIHNYSFLSHLVFQRRPSANYMCAQNVHMTHIVTIMKIIKDKCFIIYQNIVTSRLTSITKHSRSYSISSVRDSILHRDGWLEEHLPSTLGTSPVTHHLNPPSGTHPGFLLIVCKASVSAPYSTSITWGDARLKRQDMAELR